MKTHMTLVLLTFLMPPICHASDNVALFTNTTKINDAIILSLACSNNNQSQIEFFTKDHREAYPIQDGFCARFKAKYGEPRPCSLRHADLVLLDDKAPHPQPGNVRVIGILNNRDEAESCL